MLMPSRTYQALGVDGYRFSFNGMEQDDEVSGNDGDYLDFGARVYDSRLGRFLSRDPKEAVYPWQSPYVFAANNPILLIDENGEGPVDPIKKLTRLTTFANSSMNHAWKESFNWDKSEVKEVGFIIVERKTTVIIAHDKVEKTALQVKNYTKSSEGGAVNINLTTKPGEKLMGRVHTHPYSESEGSYTGIAFSHTDVSNMRHTTEDGAVSIVEAGTIRYGLVVTDSEKAKKFFETHSPEMIKEAYNKEYSKSGSFKNKVKSATLAALGEDSGIEFFETTDKDKQNWEKVEKPAPKKKKP